MHNQVICTEFDVLEPDAQQNLPPLLDEFSFGILNVILVSKPARAWS